MHLQVQYSHFYFKVFITFNYSISLCWATFSREKFKDPPGLCLTPFCPIRPFSLPSILKLCSTGRLSHTRKCTKTGSAMLTVLIPPQTQSKRGHHLTVGLKFNTAVPYEGTLETDIQKGKGHERQQQRLWLQGPMSPRPFSVNITSRAIVSQPVRQPASQGPSLKRSKTAKSAKSSHTSSSMLSQSSPF